jgi:hypothetical protein
MALSSLCSRHTVSNMFGTSNRNTYRIVRIAINIVSSPKYRDNIPALQFTSLQNVCVPCICVCVCVRMCARVLNTSRLDHYHHDLKASFNEGTFEMLHILHQCQLGQVSIVCWPFAYRSVFNSLSGPDWISVSATRHVLTLLDVATIK